MGCKGKKVDIRLPGKRDSNSHGARPVHQKHRWIRTSRLSIKKSLSAKVCGVLAGEACLDPWISRAGVSIQNWGLGFRIWDSEFGIGLQTQG